MLRGSPWPELEVKNHPPEWKPGEKRPLRFLAQYNLADLRETQVGRELPEQGLLSFFLYQIIEYSWVGIGSWLVLHTPDLSCLERLKPRTDLDEYNQISPPCRLTIVESLDIPVNSPPWDEKLDLNIESNREGWEAYSELVSPGMCLPWDNQLLGHTHPQTLGQDPIDSLDWRHLATFASSGHLVGSLAMGTDCTSS